MPRASSLPLLWLSAAVVAMFCVEDMPAQTSLTTRAGVYSASQALRGREIYLGRCRSCHTPETHTGPVWDALWNGKQVNELFGYLLDKMPKNDPGSMLEQEYIDVVAYLLRMNKAPTGSNDLPADTVRLKTITIDTPKAPPPAKTP